MEDIVDESTPDPLETVTVLKSDLDLQNVAMGQAVDDVWAIAAALGIPDQGQPPAEVVPSIIRRIRKLTETQRHVDEASAQILKSAARFGNKTIEKNGVKGLLVGKKVHGLFDV